MSCVNGYSDRLSAPRICDTDGDEPNCRFFWRIAKNCMREIFGHNGISTTMIYTHVLARPDIRVVSPLERLEASVQPSVTAVVSVLSNNVNLSNTVNQVVASKRSDLGRSCLGWSKHRSLERPLFGLESIQSACDLRKQLRYRERLD